MIPTADTPIKTRDIFVTIEGKEYITDSYEFSMKNIFNGKDYLGTDIFIVLGILKPKDIRVIEYKSSGDLPK